MYWRSIVSAIVLSVATPLAATADVTLGEDGMLSARFQKETLRDVLGELADATGVAFDIDQSADGEVSHGIRRHPLDLGLARLLSQFNHTMVYGKGEDGTIKLERVKIFAPGQMVLADYQTISSSKSPVVSAVEDRDRQGAAESPALSKRKVNRVVNPNSIAARSKIYRELQKTRQALSYIYRKHDAERKILQSKIAKVRSEIASGNGDAPELMKEIQQLEKQLGRKEQGTAYLISNEQQNMQALLAQGTRLNPPDKGYQKRMGKRTGWVNRKALQENGSHKQRLPWGVGKQ